MAGIPRKRQAVGPRFYRCLLTAVLLILPYMGLGQSAVLSGSQSSPRPVAFRILDQYRVFFGQHSITFNRVAPPVFPAPVPTPTPAPVVPTPVPYEYDDWLWFGATVYDNQYTVVQDFDGNQGLVVVSNVNFNYFSFIEVAGRGQRL